MKTAERKKSAKALLIQYDNQIMITNLDCCYLSRGAQEKTRTSTPLLAHGPEPCASTNSATWAFHLKLHL